MTTVEQFEGGVWPDPAPDATYVIRRCTELRRKPVSDFTVEDLRIMLGQRVGVPALLPRAVEVLHQDLLAEGDFYPGDLLAAVLELPETSWEELHTERAQLQAMLAGFSVEGQGDDLQSLIARFLA